VSGHRLGSQHCCFDWADRDDFFYGKIFDVTYSTLLIRFEKQTQVYNLDKGLWLYGKEDLLIQGYSPCHVTNSTCIN